MLRGGDLIQHLPEQVGHEGHRETLGIFSEHPVEVKEGTRLASIVGARHEGVKSSHHQGVGRVGEGLMETAWAEDGSLEQVVMRYQDLEVILAAEGKKAGRSAWKQFEWRRDHNRIEVDAPKEPGPARGQRVGVER